MNKITDLSRTIAAPATAIGGSIAVLRVSGDKSYAVVAPVFKGADIQSAAANTIHVGKILSGDEEIDQVVLSLFRAPHSYTGEDVIEISCHSNPLIVDKILQVLLINGADMAKPGEFTLRAFLNGKIDLSQAEAVASLISAKSDTGLRNALRQLDGSVKNVVLSVKDRIQHVLSLMEIDLDFSEENIEIAGHSEMQQVVSEIISDLDRLRRNHNFADVLNAGIRMSIIGKPNAGKSTLMNALLGKDRAITSDIPGTTRDVIRENVVIDHIMYEVVDTAGIRVTDNFIEKEGIRRTYAESDTADVILLVLDTTEIINEEDLLLYRNIAEIYGERIIYILNKSDIGNTNRFTGFTNHQEGVIISAVSGAGIDSLKKTLRERVARHFDKMPDDGLVTTRHQYEVINDTRTHMESALTALKAQSGYEFVAVDLREALHALGRITGETADDDILNRIFSGFCIGK